MMKKTNLNYRSPMKSMRRFCLDCCCDSLSTIRFCCNNKCDLWFYRFGMRPETFIKRHGLKYSALYLKENFEEGMIFDRSVVVSELSSRFKSFLHNSYPGKVFLLSDERSQAKPYLTSDSDIKDA